MLKKEYTLSEVFDYFKKHQIPSFEEKIDEFGGYFITAARIAAVILAPDALTALSNFCAGIDAASLRVSKLFSWLPDKFKYRKKGREQMAIHRYELSSVIYIKLLDIALSDSFKEILSPSLLYALKNKLVSDDAKQTLDQLASHAEQTQKEISIPTFTRIDAGTIFLLINQIVSPYNEIINTASAHFVAKNRKDSQPPPYLLYDNILVSFQERTASLFNAFLIHFSTEFPEFSLWCDFLDRENITHQLGKLEKQVNETQIEAFEAFEEKINQILEKLQILEGSTFISNTGFPGFDIAFENIFRLHSDDFLDALQSPLREEISAHHQRILAEIIQPLSDNDDIEDIIYPANKDIYIAQAFHHIRYIKKEHGRIFLTMEAFDSVSEKGEDLGLFLGKCLVDPKSSLRPIVILGNPGAGKSMFSKIFAARLCATSDYVPFLIRLRDVASSSANVSEHINKGLAQSIALTKEVNWIEWAQKFKSRIPLIILDGFDELLQSSSIELNGYINAIKELQETALYHNICLRVILTSRITVMQDVSIPEGTTIIKLSPFDQPRQQLWIDKWNQAQKKRDRNFALPGNNKILELSREPLLLFMLALYDFPSGELQGIAGDDTFNQSRLYDILLRTFSERQLKKNLHYSNLNPKDQQKELELFRLRIGMIALLMFLNDTTNRDIQRLDEELKVCKLNDGKIKSIDVLAGFFFVHQNQSTAENQTQFYNYEFLHKSFGEFLTADFMLRIAFRHKDMLTRDTELFRFCFGYNWLHKQPEIQRFLFEYAPLIFDLSGPQAEHMREHIEEGLSGLFDGNSIFPIPRFTIVEPKSRLDYLAIYSQNLIFLWLALLPADTELEFRPGRNLEGPDPDPNHKPTFQAQDRDETDPYKILWKRIAGLWQLVGNYQAAALFHAWVEVREGNAIILTRRQHYRPTDPNFSAASIVTCNDFNYAMSLFTLPNDLLVADELGRLDALCKRKPELTSLTHNMLASKFGEDRIDNALKISDFLVQRRLTQSETASLVERYISTPFVYSYEWYALGLKLYELPNISSFFKSELLLFFLRHRHQIPLKNIDILIQNHIENLSAAVENLEIADGNEYKLILELGKSPSTKWMLPPDTFSKFIDTYLKKLGGLIQLAPILSQEFIQLAASAHKITNETQTRELMISTTNLIFEMFEKPDRLNPQQLAAYCNIVYELSRTIPKYTRPGHIPLDQVFKENTPLILDSIRNNIQLGADILRALPVLISYTRNKEELEQTFLIHIIKRIQEVMQQINLQDHIQMLPYLRLFNNLSMRYSVRRYLDKSRVHKFIDRISAVFNNVGAKDNDLAIESLRFMINCGEFERIPNCWSSLDHLRRENPTRFDSYFENFINIFCK